MVTAVRASAGVILSKTQPRLTMRGSDMVGEEPGLKSVDRATGTPASISRLAGAGSSPRNNPVPGRRTAVVPASARASIQASDTFRR